MVKQIYWLIVDNEPIEPVWAESPEDVDMVTNIEPDEIVPTGITSDSGIKLKHRFGQPIICSWKYENGNVVPRNDGELDPFLGSVMQEARAKKNYRPLRGKSDPVDFPSKKLKGPNNNNATLDEAEYIIASRFEHYCRKANDNQKADSFLEIANSKRNKFTNNHKWKSGAKPNDPYRI
jgi:hypothetical protein